MRSAFLLIFALAACHPPPSPPASLPAAVPDVPPATQAMIDAYRASAKATAVLSQVPKLADGCPDPESAAQKRNRFLTAIGGCLEEPAAIRSHELDAKAPSVLDDGEQRALQQAAARQLSEAATSCNGQAWLTWPDQHGELVHRLEIDQRGIVVALSQQGESPADEAYGCCVRAALLAQRFPVLEPARTVVYDFPSRLGPPAGVDSTEESGETTTKASGRGTLTKASIRETIDGRISEVRTCYEDALATAPTLAGRVLVKFVIAHDGSVPSALVESSTLGVRDPACCITRKMRSWRFARPLGGGIVIVSYPYVLENITPP